MSSRVCYILYILFIINSISKFFLIVVHILTSDAYVLLPNPDEGYFASHAIAGADPNNPINAPTNMQFHPDGRIFVTEKGGRVRVIDTGGNLLVTPWINLIDDVSDAQDKGLLGLAFDPNFDQNKYVYLIYTQDPVYGQPDESPLAVAQGNEKIVDY
jgi:hypothetical protein